MISASQRIRSPKERLLLVSDRRHLYTSCLVVLLLTSAAINVLLAREITGLTAVIHHLKLEGSTAWQPQTGQAVPPIQIRRMDGTPVTLESVLIGDKATVIYVFSPSCKWCDRNLENIRGLAETVKEKYHLVGLSVSDIDLREYVARSGLAFPVYTMMHASETNLSRGTPRTLVVSREGKVIASWFGAYGGDLHKKVQEYFQVSLPGLSEDEPAGREPGKLACE